MTNATAFHLASLTDSRVVVDWSDAFGLHEDADHSKIQSLISWVQTYPRQSDIHVYLGPNRRKPVRLLRNTLQKMGCRVTTKVYGPRTEEELEEFEE